MTAAATEKNIVTRLVMNKLPEIHYACAKGHSLQLVLAPEEDKADFSRHRVEFYSIPTNIDGAGVFLARTPSINRYYTIRVQDAPTGGTTIFASYEV
jgi:hypothetical protein